MKDESLNDGLTIVALVLIVFFITYYLISGIIKENKLEKRLVEAQTFAIELDKELYNTEKNIELKKKKIELNNKKIIELKEDIKEYKKIDSIIKDIASNWYFKKQN